MKTNIEKLVCQSVNAQVDHPRIRGYRGGFDGRARITVGTGGITYSHQIGDACMGIAGDHIEPGVSMANKSDAENHAVQFLSCAGNEVLVLNGPCKGAKGYVTGTHGGVDHTMAYFEPEVIEQMQGTEQFLIKTFGQGLKLTDHPEIFMMNIDPRLLEQIDIAENEMGITWPVTAIIPAKLMGSGLGSSSIMEGDYDIMTQDKTANEQYGINDLRFGDFVAIADHDCTYGPHYKSGAMSIGVIVHSDSFTSGHGPGVAVVATSEGRNIIPRIDETANLKKYIEKLKNA
jgi:hypothetical protein